LKCAGRIFDRPFGNDSLNFAGIAPGRACPLTMIMYDFTPPAAKLMPGGRDHRISAQMEGREKNPTAREVSRIG